MGNGYMLVDPHCLDRGSSWRWVISFTPLPLYPLGKSPQFPMDRKQSRSSRREEEKVLDSTGIRTPAPRSSSPLPVAIPFVLTRSLKRHPNELPFVFELMPPKWCVCMNGLERFLAESALSASPRWVDYHYQWFLLLAGERETSAVPWNSGRGKSSADHSQVPSL
jgi:hypothetical protein